MATQAIDVYGHPSRPVATDRRIRRRELGLETQRLYVDALKVLALEVLRQPMTQMLVTVVAVEMLQHVDLDDRKGGHWQPVSSNLGNAIEAVVIGKEALQAVGGAGGLASLVGLLRGVR